MRGRALSPVPRRGIIAPQISLGELNKIERRAIRLPDGPDFRPHGRRERVAETGERLWVFPPLSFF
jgi:hypothetical protein